MLLACCQLAPDADDPAANLDTSADALATAVRAGADVVVLPELAVSGYWLDGAQEALARAEPAIGGTTTEAWSAALRGSAAVAVGGLCELGDDERAYNSAVVVDADGVLAVYRKTHLWDRESERFAPGDGRPPIVDTPHGRLGVCVCYDLEFPELTRELALAGADVLVVPANWPRTTPPEGERPMLATLAMATARLNRVFVAVCDRTGSERGVDYEGGSAIAGPDGWLLAVPPAGRVVETLTASCDVAEARDKRQGERNDVFGDRRPELYGPAATLPH